MTDTKKYHFNEERTPSAIRGNMDTYSKMMQWFEQLQPYFLAENYIVKNCNPESKLTAFPFIKYEDAIEEATYDVGDPSKEQTKGMYTNFEEKMAALELEKKKAVEERIKTEAKFAPPQVVYQPPQNVVSHPPQNIASQTQAATFVATRENMLPK